MASRALTSGEITLAQTIFGSNIDYNSVLIHDDGYLPLQSSNTAMTPNGESYYESGVYSADFSSATNSLKALFIHEMTHALQYQNGMHVKTQALLGGGNYNYNNIFYGTPFHELPMEAQAEFIEDYFRKVNGIPIDPHKAGGTVEDHPLSWYEARLPMDLPGAAPGNGTLDDLAGPPVPVLEPFGPWIPQSTIPFGEGETSASPIVLDIDASGTIELAALDGVGSVMWDIDQDNFLEASGWITGGDGLLCIDLNSDGIINDHGELFGGTNGYVTLAAYDTNSSNTITSADTDFGDLLVWIDSNADGFSQSGELHTLSSLGITSLSTSYSTVNYAIAGNEIKYESSFVMNGNTYTSVDAFFAYDTVNTEFVGDYTFDDRVLFMPTLRGYGNLPDLHIAMSMDEDLLDLVEEFTQLDASQIVADILNSESGAVRDILFRWAGVDGVSPTSRGSYIDAQVLEFLEELMGRDYLQFGTNPDPGNAAADFLMESWGNAFHAFATRLAYQITGADEWFTDRPTYDPISDSFGESTAINFAGIEGWFAAFDTLDEELDAARFLAEIIDDVVGIENLTTQDHTDLESILPFGSIDAFNNPIIGSGSFAGATEDDLLLGSSNGDNISGNGSNDLLVGYEGNDYLSGGADDDALIGGDDSDSLHGGTGDDTYVFAAGSGYDYLQESTGEGTDIIRLTGYDTADIRLWTSSSGYLYITNKADEADQISIVAGVTGEAGTVYETDIGLYVEQIVFDDTTNWSLASELTLEGSTSGDNIYGSQYNDTISGMDGYDTLYGNRGNDTLTGGTGADSLYGGTGDDTYVFAAGSGYDYLQESTGEGTDIVRLTGYDTTDVRLWTSSSGYVCITNKTDEADQISIVAGVTGESGTVYETDVGLYVEQIVFDDTTTWSLTSGLTLEGSTSGDNIYGSQYNDTISGMDGYDALYGNRGNDTLTGGTGADLLYGGTGDDILDGGDDGDYLDGEAGSDTLSYGSATAAVTVNLATTIAQDTVSSGWDTLAGIENLIGSAYNDTLTGDGNTNVIEGLAGNDTMDGAGGTDTLTYAHAASAVTVNLATTTGQNTVGAGTDTISNFENLTGSAYNDTLTGTSSNNVIEGGAGNDTINAQGGTDTLTYANAAAGITLNLATATAQNTGGAGTDTISNFENLTGSAFDDVLTGNTAANTITGGDGNDTVQGGAGNDTLVGGNGTDAVTYASAASAVTVNLSTTSSQNTVGAGSDTISGFENLTGSAFNDTLTGNGSDNLFEGLAGNDTMNGSGGTDTVSYANAASAVTVNLATATAQNTVGAGTDTLSSFEWLIGSAFNDTLTGSTAANSIYGGAGNDTISGGNGNDVLYGGAGTDTLTGGSNADTFVFEAATALGASDTITDFSTAQVDKLDVSDILDGYDPLTDAISDFVRITDNGTHSFLSVDADGGGNSFTQIAQLSSVTNIAAGATATETELQAMITAGTLLAA